MTMFKKNAALLLLSLIALFGFYLRFEYVRTSAVTPSIMGDAKEYLIIADNIVTKGVYSNENSKEPKPDAIRTPGYPLFLATLLTISTSYNSFYKNFLLTQIILDTLSIVLIYYLLRYFLSLSLSLLGSLLYAISPHSIVMTGYFLTETFFTFLLLSAVYVLFIAIRKDNDILYLSASSLMGMAMLVRPNLLLFPPLLLPVIFFLYKQNVKKTLVIGFLLILGVILFHIPWWIRNYNTLKKMGDNTVLVRTIAHGIYPNLIHKDPGNVGNPYKDDPEIRYFNKSFSKTIQTLLQRAEKEPIKYIKWFTYQKAQMFWQWDNSIQGSGEIYVYPVDGPDFFENSMYKFILSVMRLLHPAFLFLAFISLPLTAWYLHKRILKISQVWPVIIFAILAIYYTALHIIVVPLPRYSIPLRPILYGLALCSVHFLLLTIPSIKKWAGRVKLI